MSERVQFKVVLFFLYLNVINSRSLIFGKPLQTIEIQGSN